MAWRLYNSDKESLSFWSLRYFSWMPDADNVKCSKPRNDRSSIRTLEPCQRTVDKGAISRPNLPQQEAGFFAAPSTFVAKLEKIRIYEMAKIGRASCRREMTV